MLFEDIDIVFYDESDFYSQLNKLLNLTKVPVILTAKDIQLIKDNLINGLKDNDITFDIVKYKYNKLENNDMKALLKMIAVFENLVDSMLENIYHTKEKDIKAKVKEFFKGFKDFDSMVDHVQQRNQNDINGILNDL